MNKRRTANEITTAAFTESLASNRPSRSPIMPAVVYEMETTREADEKLGGVRPGYVYQRDAHPNADWLGEKCRELHGADRAFVTSSGMSALGLAVLALLKPGDEVLLSSRLYGKTVTMLADMARWGVHSKIIDMTDSSEVANHCGPNTRLLLAETISNPQLRVVDIEALARVSHEHQALLLIDNTFASPSICRPLDLGADLVWESMTKIMNGHSDVILGLMCSRGNVGEPMVRALSTWGMTASPFDCWLCERGLGTLEIRVQRASQTALEVAKWLSQDSRVAAVSYPGLESHPEHLLCQRQFVRGPNVVFGHMLMLQLNGGSSSVDRFLKNARPIPFCASLGELTTTISHPASTSHRACSDAEMAAVGIDRGTIRLSIGLENAQFVIDSLEKGLSSLDF